MIEVDLSIQRVSDKVIMIDSPYHGSHGVLSTYLVKGEKTLVIDPGPASQIDGLFKALSRLDVDQVDIIALTHIHLDHAAGCWRLLEAYPEAMVNCHPRGVEHVVDPSKIKSVARKALGEKIVEYGAIKGIPKEKVKASRDNEILNLGGSNLKVIWTPGHSTHSQSFFEPETRTVIVGDAAGQTPGNLGFFIPASPPPFNSDQTIDSLSRLENLNPLTLCISHFGFHQNAVERIRSFSEQVTLWKNISLKGVDRKLSLREIFEVVKLKDPVVGMMVEVNQELKDSVYSSLTGFMSYAEWVKRSS